MMDSISCFHLLSHIVVLVFLSFPVPFGMAGSQFFLFPFFFLSISVPLEKLLRKGDNLNPLMIDSIIFFFLMTTLVYEP